MNRTLSLLLLIFATRAMGQLVHPKVGTHAESQDGKVKITLVAKKQNYMMDAATRDADINSPKSVNITPDGRKYYVNSLEGGSTVVYDFATGRKLKVIHHRFDEEQHAPLWSSPSKFFRFTHYKEHLNTFMGKPVESTFTHNGRYLWVPYYRRSYDINAQDPSAVAVIDTRTDEIIRLMETGPLPKMIATSPDGKYVAISHWGDNTIGLIDIASQDPRQWKYAALHVVDHQLKLNYSLKESVNRDNGSGYALRGTVFTPDNHYLLVGCMGGGGGIAVIDLKTSTYLGRMMGMMSNVRHLVLRNGFLYLSINGAGYVQRIALSRFLAEIPRMKITGRVQDGFLHQGVPGLKVSLCRADSTVMQDSIPMTTFYYKEGVIQPQIYGTELRAQDRQYLIHTQAPGYGDIWKKVRTEDATFLMNFII